MPPLDATVLAAAIAAVCAAAVTFAGGLWQLRRRDRAVQREIEWLARAAHGADPDAIFVRLAEALARSFRCPWALVGRLSSDGRSVRTLAFWNRDHVEPPLTYELAGTPCETVFECTDLCHYERGVADLFSRDTMLRDIGADGYIGRPLCDPTGRPVGILNAISDRPLRVSAAQLAIFDVFVRRAEAELARLLASERLAAAEATHEAIVASLPMGLLTVDRTGTIRSMNHEAERLFGWTSREAVGQEVAVLVPESERARHREGFARYLAAEPIETGSRTLQSQGLRRDGTLVPLELIVSRFESAGEMFVAGAVRDITDRLRLGTELRQLAHAIDAAADAVYMTDVEGTILWVNEAFARITGYTKEEAIGRNAVTLVSTETPEDVLDSIRETVENGFPWSGRLNSRRKDGTLYQAALAVAPLRGQEGAIEAFVVIRRDVTAETQREEALLALQAELTKKATLLTLQNKELERAREAALEAARLKSEFLANMSHEIRTPMNGVIGFTQLLLETDLSPEQREYVETVSVSAESLLSVINEILDFSKVEAGKVELETIPFSPREVVSSVARLLTPKAQEKGLGLRSAVSERTPGALLGDPTRLRQILVNLVGNAVKFTREGEVTVSADAAPREDGRCDLVLTVRDTGVGIPQEKVDRLFQAFSQLDNSTARRHGGTGLGLAISRRLAELMGGSIRLTSAPGVGTTFTVTVPLAPADAASARGAEPEAPHERADAAPRSPSAAGARAALPDDAPRVLVVEDNPVNSRLAEALLVRLGARPDVARDGHEAVEAAARTEYDVILMDVQMPDMDGCETTAAIRLGERKGRRAPIVAMTARALEADRERCLAAGMDDYLTKPIRQKELVAMVEKWTGRRLTGTPAGPAPSGPAEATPRADIVSRLRDLGMLEDPEFLRETLDAFVLDSEKLLATLHDAVRSGDAVACERAAHRLKGASLNLGAGQLAEVARALEEGGRERDLSGAPERLGELERELSAVNACLREIAQASQQG